MKAIQLDNEEQELLDMFETGEFQSELTPARKEFIEQSAANAFKQEKRISIKIASRDLEILQRRALEEGISYQTLVSSILHKYVSGSLYDVSANKAVNAGD